jgi:hypothetical protein
VESMRIQPPSRYIHVLALPHFYSCRGSFSVSIFKASERVCSTEAGGFASCVPESQPRILKSGRTIGENLMEATFLR